MVRADKGGLNQLISEKISDSRIKDFIQILHAGKLCMEAGVGIESNTETRYFFSLLLADVSFNELKCSKSSAKNHSSLERAFHREGRPWPICPEEALSGRSWSWPPVSTKQGFCRGGSEQRSCWKYPQRSVGK